MRADTYELKTILTLERRYVVPTFQRDYEWTKDGQWELLFEDLEAVTARLETGRKQAEAKGDPPSAADKRVTPHFLGAIVLDQLPTSAGGLDLRSVIDGQQRLTTLQLLIRGLLDVLIELNSPRVPQVRRLISNPRDVIRAEHEQHKLWPRRRDRDAWRLAMADEDAQTGAHVYLEARRYFRDSARGAVKGLDGADRSDVVVDGLLSLFKLVVIDLEDNDDAQVIFEVLNGRQTPLSASDLVKNLLFLRAELADDAELERLYDQHWAYFDGDWWKKEIGRGHAARGRRDVLLSTWLTGTSGTEVNIGNLYGQARRYLDGSQRRIPDVLTELSKYASAFRIISEPDQHVPEPLASAYRRLDRLGMTTALPVLAWLRTLVPSELPARAHERAVKAMESWIVRRLIIGANTRGYGVHFVEVLKAGQAARKAGGDIGTAIVDYLHVLTASLRWPTDEDIETAFATRSIYGTLAQDRIRLLLGAIDERLQLEHKHGERPTFNYDALQIEHILPQTWRTHWPVRGKDPADTLLLEKERDQNMDRLGNLTLVTAPLNPVLSNSAWPVKREALKEHSKLELNAMVVSLDEWTEATILDRARTLAKVACKLWPSRVALTP